MADVVNHKYPVGARVRFRSSANREKTFTGLITGYDAKGTYAFIVDTGRRHSRAVAADRILGYAMAGDIPRVTA